MKGQAVSLISKESLISQKEKTKMSKYSNVFSCVLNEIMFKICKGKHFNTSTILNVFIVYLVPVTALETDSKSALFSDKTALTGQFGNEEMLWKVT